MLYKVLTTVVILVVIGIVLGVGILVDNSNNNPVISDSNGLNDLNTINNSNSVIDYNLSSDSLSSVITGNNEFGFKLYKELSKTENQFYSPYSITDAFAILSEASKENTKKELDDVFGYPSLEIRRPAFANIYNSYNSDNNEYKLSTANAIWVNNNFSLLPEYIGNAKKYYGANLDNLDFSNVDGAVKIINTWVENQTNGKIKDIISKDFIDSSTRIVIANAIYFKGSWLLAFKPENTEEKDFNNDFGITSKVNYMSIFDERFNYFEDSKLQAIELPYKGNQLSMIVVLPKTDLNSLNDFDNNKLNTVLSNMNFEKVDLYLPKFKLEVTYNNLKNQLIDLGLKDVFTDKADLSGFTGNKNLFVSDVIHKAFIEVNEEGTEAAAATVIGVVATAMPINPQEPKVFDANHPFMFYIIDKETRNILFMGQLVNP